MPTDSNILFSIDLEDHTGGYSAGARYIDNARRYLDFLEEQKLAATFFTVGRVAVQAPGLIREIARRGHEIACHSQDHTPLTQQDRTAFKRATAEAKDILEQASGQAVLGYRAPIFSLTPKSPWAAEVLTGLNFTYSSSILPGRNPLHGFPGAPMLPFAWPSGLVELPVVLGGWGPVRLPFLGGFYLRYLPLAFIRHSLRQLPAGAIPWTYIHPYDIDSTEKNWKIDGAANWVSLLLWLNRRRTFARLQALRPLMNGVTFAEAAGALQDLPTWPSA